MITEYHPFPINKNGHLEIGGMDTVELAEKYGTPLYVYDVSMIRKNARSFVETFERLGVQAKVAYASKAFSSIAMLQVAKQENLCLDVVSEGELYTALLADFPVEKIHLHGNNKSLDEITMAIKHDIGCIVIDNFYDIELIEQVTKVYGKKVNVLIRVTPGVESHTHEYIMTGNEDSKFGFDLQNGQAEEAFQKLLNHETIHFRGLHCHIGSQIFETDGFKVAVDLLFEELGKWKERYNYTPEVLNLGGGFGIRYTKEDQPLPYNIYVEELIKSVRNQVNLLNISMPEIWIEPGRAIVGNTGITLYTIGSMKNIPDIRKYVSVNGGMTDNIRPALYQAKYDAVIANKANQPVTEEVSIAGKACESGDMLIWDLSVPNVEHGDILAVFSTGAYNYSMASHYNRIPNAAVVFVENGVDKLVVKRETMEDVVRNDLSYL
ncbi:diaminopimelate decarboxylase [Oceanobacillus caeni]|uniref:diaminopimelate decarboxylase n=1 Tax=Oceanobacillus TaxID=182709 RepID=UPI00195DB2C8|nr:diaminopimelate decarboxylase [Oceanobacillus caeni]MBU8789772.1 diaminopimelate decarboxylase [Oceanobacillus caeni]MCR1834386.1 diaminopimelate decarboxylase [Oceanobacillus caeni]MED4474752.1 diaminopimelate decarboxylase [Oceanobacillus caeni]